MTEHYTEPIAVSEPIRKLYADSISNATAVLRTAAMTERETLVTPEKMAANREEYRRQLHSLLGVDTCRAVFGTGIPEVTKEPVGEDTLCTIERLKIRLYDGIYFTGLLQTPRQKRANAPLVVMSHGGGGSPELCSDIIGNNNYVGIVRRMLTRGVIVFAPQLLLWNFKPSEPGAAIPTFGTPYNRHNTDRDFKQCGTSIAGFEIYAISRSLDWLFTQSNIDSDNCGMTGLSYGGFYTLYTMACETRIKCGWSAAFFSDRLKYNWYDFVWQNSAGRFTDAEIAGLCAPRKLWCDIGKQDPIFLPDGIEEHFSRAEDFYKAAGAADAVHMNLWKGGHRYSDSDEHTSGAFEFFMNGIGATV